VSETASLRRQSLQGVESDAVRNSRGRAGNADASAHRDLPQDAAARGRAPFAWHQLHWLAAQGISEVIYSIGHHGDMIRRYWAASQRPFPPFATSTRASGFEARLEPCGWLAIRGVLDESFFVIYGDSFLPVEFAPVWRAFQAGGQPALMTVLRNEGRWDRSNVIYEPGPGSVVLYDKEAAPGMQYIDYGLSCFRRDLFDQSDALRSLGALPRSQYPRPARGL
jgi:NDP-sugar pyrophosphorylase family protein